MKIFLTLLVLTASSIIFYSCASDTIVTPPVQQTGFQWDVVTTIPIEEINYISAVDENTIFCGGYTAYKISYGVKTPINFQDSHFVPSRVEAYSADYYAFGGVKHDTAFGKAMLKIYNNSVLTNIILDENSSAGIKDMLILEPGKIAMVTSSKLYLYDNGALSAFASPDSFSTNFNFITSVGNAFYINGGTRRIYKFENNTLTLVNTEAGGSEFLRMKINNMILKSVYSPAPSALPTIVSGWNGTAWSPICSDSSRKIMMIAAGENINLIYFLAVDSTLSLSYGKIWTGARMIDDPNYPADNASANLYTRALSNMRSGNVFISKYGNYTSTIYRGKKNF